MKLYRHGYSASFQSYTLTTETAVNENGRVIAADFARIAKEKMIGARVFKLLYTPEKSLWLNRCLFTLSFRTSETCLSFRSFHSNFSPELAAGKKHVARRFASHESPEQAKRQSKSPVDASSQHHHTITILQRLHDLEQSFRVRGHSVLRLGLIALVVAGFIIYVFRETLRENVADEVADVASRSLGKAIVELMAV